MKTKKWVISSLGILVIFLLLALTLKSYLSWRNNYRNNIYPGIKFGSLDLGGQTESGAQELINKRVDEIITGGLIFQFGNKKTNINLTVASFDAGLSYPALAFNVDGTLNQALAYSQPKNFLNYLIFKIKAENKKTITPVYLLDEQKIKNLLADAFTELNIPAVNASFFIDEKTGELRTGQERLGKEINYDLVISEIKNNLDNLNNSPIAIKTRTKYPEVKAVDLSSLTEEAKKIVNLSDLELSFTGTEANATTAVWLIKPEKLLTWVSIKKESKNLILTLDQEKITQYLTKNISPKTDLEAIRPRFEIKNGKVVNWQVGANGRQVDIEASTKKIIDEFLNGQRKISLIVKEVSDETAGQATDAQKNLNIKEIVGTGHSNFSGSPANRRKNIQVGANAAHGILLAPGEEFSLVKVLGDVSEKTGYFPELVIKGNKTIPEYGGGLCQIGTTLFRAALASGLPITARRNHSYRVSYYEPAGMDAAVYIPNPDVRFINDTANYILIQARIIKNDIYFDFWGTKDGRISSTTKPTVYNIVKPEPTKYIETLDLPAGEKKCTEKAHNGADAYFDYKVIYPEGSTTTPIQERRFSSHYVPWQEVCLIGVSATSTATTTAANTGASSSAAIINPAALN